MADAIGQQFGSYRLLRLLGTGSFASVYLGEHQYLERPAAIKVLHVQMDQEADASFRREARTIAHLDHPHIVRILDFGIQSQIPYLVMEYTPNGTLRMLHPKGSRLFCEQIVPYVRQIASALDYAHQQGVIHRDVKPENLLMNVRGEVLLSDFGIAVVEHTLDTLSRSKMAGTPLYMAPEQIQRRSCPASDQYALGVMVYEWLAGAPPFPGPGFAVFGQHLYQSPPSLRAYLPHLHPAVESAVFRALDKDPAQRFACVTDFATALEEACSVTQPFAARSAAESLPQEFGGPTQPLSGTSGSSPAMRYAVPPASHLARPLLVAPQTQVSAASLQRQNRLRLLRRVHAFWIEGVLEHSLHGAALMTLGLQTRPDAVANPWHLALQQPEAAPQLLPAGTRITDLYDAADGELLILGAPGAGKTTLLLELTRDLLKRAEQDEQHPLPVVFNLSSWAGKQQPLLDWLAEELITKYQVPRKSARALLSADQILPLLDGLDEVTPTARTACIEAINTYRQEHGFLPLVVCGRQADYLSQTARVLVRSAVLVQPLTQEQVDTYLEQGGRPLWALRMALHQDATLRELTSTPLMLSILTLTYHGKPVKELLRDSSLEGRQRRIFEQYVRRMLTRRGPLQMGTPQQVVKWLAYLAARMHKRNQTVFYLEGLQPDWLSLRMRRVYEWWGVQLPGILIGVLVALGISSFLGTIYTPYGFAFSSGFGGFLGGMISGDVHKLASSSEHRISHFQQEQQRPRIIGRVVISILVGLLISLSDGFYPGNQYGLSNWLYYGSISAIVISSGCLFLQMHLISIKPHILSANNQDMRGWKPIMQIIHVQRALRTSVIMTFIGGLVAGLPYGLRYGLLSGLLSGMFSGLSSGINFGLICMLISLLLDRQAEMVSLNERLRWTWGSLVNSLLLPKHSKTTLALISIITLSEGLYSVLFYGMNYGLIVGLIYGSSNGLHFGLLFGLSYWVVAGLFGGISSEQIEEQSRQIPGQGIHYSLRNCILMGVISSGVIWLTSILTGGLSIGLVDGLASGLYAGSGTRLVTDLSSGLQIGLYNSFHYGWIMGLCGGLVVCAISGGVAYLRHCILRWLLRRSGAFPRDSVRFLDEAASCILLQKVGGGYSFVHRLLLEYFASLDSTPSTDLVSLPVNPGESRSRSSWLTLISTLPTSPLPQEQIAPRSEHRRFLRREVVIGFVGIGGTLALGGVGWLLEQRISQLPAQAHNLDFTQGITGWFLTGSQPQGYACGIDSTEKLFGRPAAYLRARVARPAGFGTLMQAFQGTAYRGKRLRLSGYVKAQAVEQWAGLWMRVDGSQGHILSFDNMVRRPIRGTVDWKRYEIVLDVPQESTDILFGILLNGKGQLWFSAMQFQVVGKEVPTTG